MYLNEVVDRNPSDDLGNELANIIYTVSDAKGFALNQFGKFLSWYQRDRVAKLDEKKEKVQIQALTDKLDAIRQCYQSLEELNSIEKKQERHLHYVVLTRAMQELWFAKGN